MRLLEIRHLSGPNVHHHRPVLEAWLDLGPLDGRESRTLPGFDEGLLALLPGLRGHHCSEGRPGGFVSRLAEGTWLGHVVEHVALELDSAAGTGPSGGYGKTRHAGRPGIYKVVLRTRHAPVTALLLREAVGLVAALARGARPEVEPILEKARRLRDRVAPGPSTQAVIDAAEARGIPCRPLDAEEGGSLVQLGHGARRHLVEATLPDTTGALATDLAGDKERTKELLRGARVPVPDGRSVRSPEEAVRAAAELRPPWVVKPRGGNHGRAVRTGLTTPDEVARAVEEALRVSSAALVEEQLRGQDVRVLVVADRVVAAALRMPAAVNGDGERSVAELVAWENTDPRRGEGHSRPLTRIRLDGGARALLQRQGLTPRSVPEAGRVVVLSHAANLSTGGTSRDLTDALHPDVALACRRAARAVGLDVCGVDLVAEAVDRPLRAGEGVVEVNAAPGIRMHHHPSEGATRDAAGAILDRLFPGGQDGRIPLVAITGTNGKTTVTRMIGHILQSRTTRLGLTTTEGIWIEGRCVERGDTTGPQSARVVLSDPGVEIAVLETARGGIMHGGLGWDLCDVAVLTNIQPDHLGQDGLEDLEDIVRVKSLVAERVKEGGTLVLNADDPILAGLPGRPRLRNAPRRTAWFSLDPDNPLIRAHRAAGGASFVLREGTLVEGAGDRERPLLRAEEIPAAIDGLADFQVANALAAAAACRALDVRPEAIAAGLRSFRSDRHNAGRAQWIGAGPGRILLDYGHNPGAIGAVGRMVARLAPSRATAIVGAPGDRADSLIVECGRVAGRAFRRLILTEDLDLRGRAPGEAPGLLRRGVQEVAPGADCRVIRDRGEALLRALDEMVRGEVVVVFFDEDLEGLIACLRRAGLAVGR